MRPDNRALGLSFANSIIGRVQADIAIAGRLPISSEITAHLHRQHVRAFILSVD